MADICEVCLTTLKHWTDGVPDYDEIILCNRCSEEVEEIENIYEGKKEFEWCVEKLRKKIKVIIKK